MASHGRRRFIQFAGAAFGIACTRGAGQALAQGRSPILDEPTPPLGSRLVLSDAQWRERLTPEQFYILRREGTEAPFTGAYWNNHAAGTYLCAGCAAPLFSSQHKFDSGTGWPSYWQPIESRRVEERQDTTLGMIRREVHCARCDGHLGHIFEDGPPPTGLRYCIDSAALVFRPDGTRS